MRQEDAAKTWRAGTGLLPIWEANYGCHCEIEGLALSMAKPPPTAAFPPPPPPPAPEPLTRAQKQAAKDAQFERNVWAALDGVAAFGAWLKNPLAPKAAASPTAPTPAPTPAPAPPVVQIKPFDIQDIPATMRKLHMPVSASMMERWFRGQLNYSPTEKDELSGLNQNGQPYPPSMIDKSIITMDWVLKFKRARTAFENLTEDSYYAKDRWSGKLEASPQLHSHSVLRAQGAYKELRRALLPYWQRAGSVITSQLCNRDIERLHREFQFQFIQVDGTLDQKIAEQLRVELTNKGLPDDLTGALGSFNLYAAVSRFHIERSAKRVVAVITGM